jgi:hypothetical protein
MNEMIIDKTVHMSAAQAGLRVSSFAERCARRAGKTARNG